jgi:hypothetical protein
VVSPGSAVAVGPRDVPLLPDRAGCAVREHRASADDPAVAADGIGGADALLSTMAMQASDAWGVAVLGKALDSSGSSTLALLMSMPAPSPAGLGGSVDVYA